MLISAAGCLTCSRFWTYTRCSRFRRIPRSPRPDDGFARENAEGIGLEAGSRNYKDDNHKPEIGVALTEFWMLHGFRPLEQIADTFDADSGAGFADARLSPAAGRGGPRS